MNRTEPACPMADNSVIPVTIEKHQWMSRHKDLKEIKELQSPVFRKMIVPWYDSEAACFILILMMEGIYLFGAVGITVVRNTPAYQHHIWLPVSLMVLSAGVIISVTCRLVQRFVHFIRYRDRL